MEKNPLRGKPLIELLIFAFLVKMGYHALKTVPDWCESLKKRIPRELTTPNLTSGGDSAGTRRWNPGPCSTVSSRQELLAVCGSAARQKALHVVGYVTVKGESWQNWRSLEM